jgi:tetratricopeptide (TPR) repeat protein
MAKKIKLTRKQMKKPDEFLSWTEEAWEWMEENLAYAVGTLVGGIAIILLVQWGVRALLSNQDPSAGELTAAADVLNKPIIDKNDPRSFDGYQSEQQRAEAAADEFKGFIRQHPDTKYTDMAYLYLGRVYEDMRDWPNALDSYQKLSQSKFSQKDKQVQQSAIMGMARAEFGGRNFQAALDHYKKIMESDSIFKLDAMIGAARCDYELGNVDNAKKTLAKAKEEFPESYETQSVGFLPKYWAAAVEDEKKEAEAKKEKGTASPETPKPTEGATAEKTAPEKPVTPPENPTPTAPAPPEPAPSATAGK